MRALGEAGERARRLQSAQAPPSSRHSKRAPGSLDENANVAVVAVVTRSGALSIVVSGAMPEGSGARDHSARAGVGSTLPAASIARTSKTCAPFASPSTECGLAHACQAPPSSLHSNESGSSELSVP